MMTDEFASYTGLDNKFNSHQMVNHGQGQYPTADNFEINTNTVESFFALLKRGHIGTFHYMSETHLDRYNDESTFRWNNRKVSDGQRLVNLMGQTGGKRLKYSDLITKEEKDS